ncbi:MAG TPA: helix-turn-helix domain-containing protein [Actinocrinis sp.]|nr:helix-turn-helix domain-containing protein [Actinocrinis sp.]
MSFEILGLTEDAGHAYTALVRNPHCTSAELAKACDIPVAAAGRLLAHLVAQGLATRARGRPSRFSAAPPDTAISKLISERENELARARALVHRLAEMHREATRISDPDLAVELLGNRDDVSLAVHRLVSMAQHEVRAFDRPPYVDRPGHDVKNQIERQRHGVRHRVIYDRAALEWPGRLRDDIIPSMRAGEASRVHPDLPLKLVIADDAAAIMPFSLAPGGHAAAYLIHRSPVLFALECLFESYWDRATPIPDDGTERRPEAAAHDAATAATPATTAPATMTPATRDGGSDAEAPDPQTRMLLSLLAAGLTDKSIARAMGWSERTAQRRIQQLMITLNAVTRFQASLMAVRRGWL